jgi:hypothetical protein
LSELSLTSLCCCCCIVVSFSSQFNQHVIIETNKTTERIFPAVPDVEHPEFFNKMDELVKLNRKVRLAATAGVGFDHTALTVLDCLLQTC